MKPVDGLTAMGGNVIDKGENNMVGEMLVGEIIDLKVKDTLQNYKITEKRKHHTLGWLFNGYLDDWIETLEKNVKKTGEININDLIALIKLFTFNAITNSDLVELDGTSFGQLIYEDNNSHNPESLLTHYAYKIRLLLT